MIKGIALQRVEITEDEFKIYKELSTAYGEGIFSDLFQSDLEGKITVINPKKSVPWGVVFFVQNLMINQWLRSYDLRIKNIEESLGKTR